MIEPFEMVILVAVSAAVALSIVSLVLHVWVVKYLVDTLTPLTMGRKVEGP